MKRYQYTSPYCCSQEETKGLAAQRLELTASATLGTNSMQAKQSESELTDESSPLEQLDITKYLVIKKPDEEGPDVRGGHPDALIIHATKANKNGEFRFVNRCSMVEALCCILNSEIYIFFSFMLMELKRKMRQV
jgi:hypothetical protein